MLIAQLILFQVFIFALLVIVLRYVISKRVKLDKAQLQQMGAEYVQKEQEIRREQEKIKQEHDETVNKAAKEAAEILVKAQEEAKEEATRIVDKAQAQSEQVVQRAEKCAEGIIGDIEEKIKRGAVDKGCDLIGRILPEDTKKEIHAKYIGELINSSFDALSHMNIAEDIKEIEAISPYKLSEKILKEIKEGVKKYVKTDIDIKESIVLKLIAGIVIKIDNVVLDGSLLYRAKKIAKETKEE